MATMAVVMTRLEKEGRELVVELKGGGGDDGIESEKKKRSGKKLRRREEVEEKNGKWGHNDQLKRKSRICLVYILNQMVFN